MAERVYIETTIISYLTARLSRDLIVAAHQQVTHEWWDTRRTEFELFTSQLVIQEASLGDEEAARRRLEVLVSIPLLAANADAISLARLLTDEKVVPEAAAGDALHIAVSTVHDIDYLLTWNCRHIANAEVRRRLSVVCQTRGYEPPIICTPEELMGD